MSPFAYCVAASNLYLSRLAAVGCLKPKAKTALWTAPCQRCACPRPSALPPKPMFKHALLAAGAIVGRSAEASFRTGRSTPRCSAQITSPPRAGLSRRLRARGTITPHRCEARSLPAGPGPEARARVRRRTSAVDNPRRRAVARHRRGGARRRMQRPQAPHERQRARRVLRERLRVHGPRGEAQGSFSIAGPRLHLPALRHDPPLPGDGHHLV